LHAFYCNHTRRDAGSSKHRLRPKMTS
jgi:hypothetical protein